MRRAPVRLRVFLSLSGRSVLGTRETSCFFPFFALSRLIDECLKSIFFYSDSIERGSHPGHRPFFVFQYDCQRDQSDCATLPPPRNVHPDKQRNSDMLLP